MSQLRKDAKAKVFAFLALVIFSNVFICSLTGLMGAADTGMEISAAADYDTLLFHLGLAAQGHSGLFIALAILSVIIIFAVTAFLMWSAGYRKGADNATLGTIDKIPLDIWMVFTAIADTFIVSWIVSDINYWYWTSGLVCLVIGCSLLSIFTAGFLVTFAARLKCGDWWKNTIIFMFLLKPLCRFGKFVYNSIKQIIHNMNVVWKALLIYILFCTFAIIFCVNASYGSSFAAFLLGLLGLVTLLFISIFAIQYSTIASAAAKMAAGDLDYRVDTRNMFYTLKRHGIHLNSISEGMSRAVDERMKSEHFKTELITNVSHDLKTPLTSIINYVDLLQKIETNNPQAKEYLDVLARQAAKLKKLTEDLVAASKASTGNIKMELSNIDMNEFVEQIAGEYADKLRSMELDPITTIPSDRLVIMADGRYLWRVFDNLFNNVCKYAQPHTRVFISLSGTRDKVRISLKNTSRELLNITADELMERFVRGDSSRSSEGSGLGLSIARSLTELQKGSMQLYVDGDLFKIELEFDRIYD